MGQGELQAEEGYATAPLDQNGVAGLQLAMFEETNPGGHRSNGQCRSLCRIQVRGICENAGFREQYIFGQYAWERSAEVGGIGLYSWDTIQPELLEDGDNFVSRLEARYAIPTETISPPRSDASTSGKDTGMG